MRLPLSLLALVLLGGGCVSPIELFSNRNLPEVSADEVDFTAGDAFRIQQTWLGLNVSPAEDEYGNRDVTLSEWSANTSAKLAWTKIERRETADSRLARENAMKNVGVGEEANIPAAVYETVNIAGSITTDGLQNAERILLPSYWPEGEYDVRGKGNSVVWLSRAQYDELASTRSSHVQLGLFDSTLQDILNFTEGAKGALDKLQGKIATSETSNKDFTKLDADSDWGSYSLLLNGQEVKVKTINASNAFANYIILANPENPLILKVTLRPWALGPSMLTSLNELKALVGYQITSIYTSQD